MSEDSTIPPGPESESSAGGSADPESNTPQGDRWNTIWNSLMRLGLAETAIRIGAGLLLILLVGVVVWVMGRYFLTSRAAAETLGTLVPQTEAGPTLTPAATIPALVASERSYAGGIPRLAIIHTDRPSTNRFAMVEYTIEKGDSLFGIAERFGIKPASILFSNQNTLFDDPHLIYPGQQLTIPPIDGAIYQWHAGDGLNGVAKYFSVSVDDIINWPSNNLSAEQLGDLSNPAIPAGTMLFIPGGTRAFTSWSAPFISRTDPAQARVFGPGYCGKQYEGYIGNGAFIWPTTETWLSGYDFTPETNHWAIDIAGQIGNSIFASDSGVVVYSGWANRYGNLVIIDHGTGWQTLYAHLNTIGVSCGQSVSQGAVIAGLGTTGNSSGPHLHFEIMSETGGRVNPHSFLNQ